MGTQPTTVDFQLYGQFIDLLCGLSYNLLTPEYW